MMRARLALLASAVAILTGCSNLANRIDADSEETGARAHGLINNVGRSAPGVVGPDTPAVEEDNGIWLGKQAVKLGDPPLPGIFYEPASFDRHITSLSEFAERITLRSGIPVKVQADAADIAGQFFYGASPAGSFAASGMPFGRPGDVPSGQKLALPAAAAGMMTPGRIGNANLAPSTSVISRTGGNGANGGVRISYNGGSFKGLLDTAAARFGVYWKYTDGVIQFFHTEARTFQINAIPGDSAFEATVGSAATSQGGVNSSSGGSGGGSSSSSTNGINSSNTQKTEVNSKLSVYTGIENAVKVMLSPAGKVLASQATGGITVVDTPDSLDRIAAYVEQQNKSLSRQVVINVTVLTVTLSEGDAYGINWNAVYSTLNRRFGLSSSYSTNTSATPAAFSAGIIGSSRLSGTNAVIEALSTQGRVKRQTTASVVTLNNQPVPVQVARQTSYLASTSATLVSQVGSTTSLTPGTVTSGFNMSILPHVLTNGTVMLQFSTDISNLIGLRPITSGNSTIEVPELDTRNFLQRVAMKSNETLIISGFEQSNDSNDRQGIGNAKNLLLGGGMTASSSKDVIVILVTPVTMNSPI